MSRTALLFRIGGDLHRVEGHTACAGRSRECDIRCDERGVSRRHCEIIMDREGVSIRDLGSKHGTWIHDRQVKGERRIRVGTVLRLGRKGPKIELAGALLEGKKLTPDGREFIESRVGSSTETARPRPAPAKQASPARAAAAPYASAQTSRPATASTSSSTTGAPPDVGAGGFGKGLVWGIAAGVTLGVALLVLVDLTSLIDGARKALGLG